MRFLFAGLLAAAVAPACLAESGDLAAPPVAHGRQASDETPQPPECTGQEPRDCSSGLVPLCNQGQWYCGSPGDTVLPGVTCPPGEVKDAGQGCVRADSRDPGKHHDEHGHSDPKTTSPRAAHHDDDAGGSNNDRDDADHGKTSTLGQSGDAANPPAAKHHDDANGSDGDKDDSGTQPKTSQ